MEVTVVVIVSAGTAPHTIFRCFDAREDALRWARMLHAKGLNPVTVDCEPIESVIAREESSAERPDRASPKAHSSAAAWAGSPD